MGPTTFAMGVDDGGDAPENCDDHLFFVGIWEHTDTARANTRTTRYTINNRTLNKKTTYAVQGSHCTVVESGIIESCEKEEAPFNGTFKISQAIKIKVHDIEFSFHVPKCRELFSNQVFLPKHMPYSYVETFSLILSDDEWSNFLMMINGLIFL